MKTVHRHKDIVKHWREDLTQQERMQGYLDSIPQQVMDSMAFEGEPVSLDLLKKHLKSLKTTAQPLGS